MRYRHLFLLYALILLLSLSHAGRGEEHSQEPGNPGATPTARPAAETKLDDNIVGFLAQYFSATDDFLKKKYGERLPQALEKAIQQNDEGEIAKLLSELFGTLNTQQVKKLQEVLKAPVFDCGSAEPANVGRLDALKKRIAWAAEKALKIDYKGGVPACTMPMKDRFLGAFDPEWTKIKDKNEVFHAKLKDALAGNEAAKEFLRTNYDNSAVLGFLEAQGKTGNEKLANDLARALSSKGEDGGHFLDMTGSGAEKDRLHLGKEDGKFNDAVQAFSKERGSLGRFTFSPKPHDKPTREFRMKPEVAPPPREAEHGKAKGGPTPPEKGGESKGGPGPGHDGEPKPAPPPIGDSSKGAPTGVEKAAADVIKAKCVTCHGPGKEYYSNFKMTADGKPETFSKAKLRRILKRAVTEASMPVDGEMNEVPLSAGEKAAIKAWVEQATPGASD